MSKLSVHLEQSHGAAFTDSRWDRQRYLNRAASGREYRILSRSPHLAALCPGAHYPCGAHTAVARRNVVMGVESVLCPDEHINIRGMVTLWF